LETENKERMGRKVKGETENVFQRNNNLQKITQRK
jgi:hypothetical protein